MSLEDHLSALTKAVEANTAALGKIVGAAAAKPAAAGKPAGAAAGASKPAGAAANAKPKAPTIDDIRAKFGGYLSTKDAALRATRLEQVAAIVGHFGVAKASDIDPANFAEALGYLAEYEAGNEPEFAAADDAGEGESLV